MAPVTSHSIVYEEVLHETADSIEAIPNTGLFTCATYQLIEKKDGNSSNDGCQPTVKPDRVGTLMLYNTAEYEDCGQVECMQKISMKAVLDMKWNGSTEKILSIANACGSALFYKLTDNRLSLHTQLLLDSDALVLSTDWCKSVSPENVVYSLSNGNLSLVKLSESAPVVVKTWKGHSMEAWIIAADCNNPNLFYSGADDCLLKLWDARASFCKPSFTSKHHAMGVCSLQSSEHNTNHFCSGSYDETIAVWDNRNMRKALNVTETGGGVWRLKWHPLQKDLLLAACMHSGYHIVKYDNNFTDSDIIFSYDKHDSLAYGVDWCGNYDNKRSNGVLTDDIIVCCSFYDKLLTIVKLYD